mgnify:CR=1 FL=1
MNKLFGYFVLVFGILFFSDANALDACSKDYSPIASRYNGGVAFVVQKCGGRPNLLLGTMHSDNPALMQMHEKSLPALKAAQNAVFEIKFDNEAIQTTLAAMFYNPASGQTLRTEVGDELYNRFMKVVTKPDPMNEYFKPWAAAIMLQYPRDVADGVELDLKLQNMAKQQGTNIAGLEKVEEQLGIFTSMPKAEQVQSLRDVLDNYDENLAMQKDMQVAYMAKDLNALYRLIPESLELSSDKEAAKQLMKLLIDDRNVRMSDRMVKYLDEGNAYIAIGALHLPGNVGVLKLLEDKGYRIEALY